MSFGHARRLLARALICGAALVALDSRSLAQDASTMGPVLAPPTSEGSGTEAGTVLGLPQSEPSAVEPAAAERPVRVIGAPEATPAPAAPAAAAPAPASAPSADRESFGDWERECYEPAVSGIRCQLVHQVQSGQNQQTVLVFSLAYDASSDSSDIQIALPLGFALREGVQISLGDGFSTRAMVDRCTAQGCLVEGTASPEMLEAMIAAASGRVDIVTMDGAPISLPLSLAGFANGYEAMRRENSATASQ